MSTVSGENPDNLEEASSVAIKHAKNGKAWAQFQIGLYHSHGLFGFSLDEEKGLQLIKQAAEQRDSDALLELALALALAYSGETLEPDKAIYALFERGCGSRTSRCTTNAGHSFARDNSDEKGLHYTPHPQ